MTKEDSSILFFLAGALFDYNLAVAKILKDRNPNLKLSAFVCGRKILLDAVEKQNNTKYAFDRYDFLNDMITEWLDQDVDYKKLDYYRECIGDDNLRRIITADREVGVGYVAGGFVEKTKLIRFFEKHPEKRWSYVIGLLDYCFDVIKDQKPDVIYTYGVAGSDAIALHFAAEYFKIPAVQLAYARHEDFYILDPDVRMGMPLVKKMYEKALIDPSIVNKDYKNIAEKYIKDFCGKPERPLDTVYWVNKIKRENSYRGFLKTLVIEAAKMTAIELGLKGSRGIWRQRSGVDIFKFSLLKFWQLKRMKSRDFTDLDSIIKTNKYIYYPLHVDPEMTTMVMADKLTDQTSVIEHLSKQIPAGWKVVVKDHIPMIGKRSKAFYDRIRSMPDVCLVSPFEDNFKCMKHSETICTITGTAGWESMLLGKVPIVMGYPHYINLQEGFVHCTEPTKLSQAIKESQQLDVVSKDKMTLYAACMLDNAFDLPTSYYWFNDTLTDDHFKQSTNDLANKLSEYL